MVFYTETFEAKENKSLISPAEWQYAVNNHCSDYPVWFQKLKNNCLIMRIFKSLDMVLSEYEINLIQTPGKKDIRKYYWTLNNGRGIIMKIDWQSLRSGTSFYLINSHIEHIKFYIDVRRTNLRKNKSHTTQIARTLELSKIITSVEKISSFQEVLDQIKEEGLSIHKYELKKLSGEVVVLYSIRISKYGFWLELNTKEQYYSIYNSEFGEDYIQFDINYMSTYSFRHILYSLANLYTSKDYHSFDNDLSHFEKLINESRKPFKSNY